MVKEDYRLRMASVTQRGSVLAVGRRNYEEMAELRESQNKHSGMTMTAVPKCRGSWQRSRVGG